MHSGQRALQTGIDTPVANVYTYSSVEQTLALPADASQITLGYWYQADIDGIAGQSGNDYAYVLMRPEGAGWVLLHIIRQDVIGWTREVHDLSTYAGQTITLRIGTYNNGRDGVSLMHTDDISIQVCQEGTAPPPTYSDSLLGTHLRPCEHKLQAAICRWAEAGHAGHVRQYNRHTDFPCIACIQVLNEHTQVYRLMYTHNRRTHQNASYRAPRQQDISW